MLNVKPCSLFGVEIDLDLSQPRTSAIDAALQALYDRHHFLTFRGQNFSLEAQIKFAALFGPVLMSEQDGVGFLSNMAGEGSLGDSELAFHSDLSFSPKPMQGLCLLATDVQPGRSSTRFVSSIQAYQRLPEALKTRIENYHAQHVFGANLSGRNLEDLPAHLPRQIHPLVMAHPRSGEKLLYVNYNQTARIVELSKPESDKLIDELFHYAYQDGAIQEQFWHNGDFVMWDNIALQHARGNVANVGRRTLRRVVVAEAGFYDQHPEFMRQEYETAPGA